MITFPFNSMTQKVLPMVEIDFLNNVKFNGYL